MAGEGDECKWVGIRPTNPAENIPVTESSPITSLDVTEQVPLTDIKVSPSAGSPEFLTRTRKRAPAIGDLQAPIELIRIYDIQLNVGAPSYEQLIYTVPSDKLFMLQFLSAYSAQADPTLILFNLKHGAVAYSWYSAAYGGASETHTQFVNLLYDEDELVIVKWVGTLAATDVTTSMFGYLMDRY